ncbi:MAG: SDR family NAD(P)-dependent oxidoreductase [Myxococcota bacterium]|jgi:NAD(P)-dependent dehydrogenase (short-subunit alcohol dehydrogenase family)
MGKLAGKVAFVTGASRGIGREIALLFASEGARVACSARTVAEGDHKLFEGSLRSTVEAITSAGGEARAVPCDVSEYQNCVTAIVDARESLGPIDVLVNNAALTYFIPIDSYPIAKWHRSFAVNLHAPFYLSQLALEDMIPRKSGSIVNISSGAAIGPGRGPYTDAQRMLRGGTLYGTEKAALERFTQGLASEVYDDGVSVTCVSPSQVVPTPGTVHHKLVRDLDDPRGESVEIMARAALLLATEPLERVSGRVTYSQQILTEFGWMKEGQGLGFDRSGSGYSKI